MILLINNKALKKPFPRHGSVDQGSVLWFQATGRALVDSHWGRNFPLDFGQFMGPMYTQHHEDSGD